MHFYVYQHDNLIYANYYLYDKHEQIISAYIHVLQAMNHQCQHQLSGTPLIHKPIRVQYDHM